jgi:hypothetical protein
MQRCLARPVAFLDANRLSEITNTQNKQTKSKKSKTVDSSIKQNETKGAPFFETVNILPCAG